jgi:hypothetical protein
MITGPASLTDLLPETVAEMGRRAARPDFDRWVAQAKGCGHCSRPIRLRGTTTTRTADGRLLEVFSTAREPDGVTYIRCGNRRAAVCPSCSHEYQGDMWHLLYAGTAGGIKDVPKQVAEHPLTFLTLTAPSFGPVHTIRGQGKSCRPGNWLTLCMHGRPQQCRKIHAESDPDLGTPLCADCYDYGGQVAFNWYAPELWRRFTIALRRQLADRIGVQRPQLGEQLVVSFAKVAEFQRRGVVHFHALIRLDGPGDGHPAPALAVTAEQLGGAIQSAALAAWVVTDRYEFDGRVGRLRFGDQIDVRPVYGDANREASMGPMHPQMVAAYIAKYATKAADDFGLTPHRINPATDLATLPVSDHVRRLLSTAIKIGSTAADTIEHTDRAKVVAAAKTWLPILRWLHMLGFRGHFSTKSRRFSTTLGRLRAERRTWRRRHELNCWPADQEDEQDETTLVIVRDWAFHGIGWLTAGDAALAASAAARAREHREYARDAQDTDHDHD